MSIEWAFIVRVLEEPANRAWRKVPREAIEGDSEREAWSVILSQVEEHGAVPSVPLLAELGVIIPEEFSDDTMEALVEAILQKFLYADIARAVERVVVGARDDPRGTLAQLGEDVAKMSVKHAAVNDVDAAATAEDVMERYAAVRDAPEGVGVPWPWEHIQEQTRGIRPGQYIVFYGRAKSYKTWLLLYVAFNAYMRGHRPIFATREMPQADVQDMLTCLVAKIDWGAFTRGDLNDDEEGRLAEAIEWLRESPPFPIVEVGGFGLSAIAEFESKIRHYNANLGIFDGVYLLDESGGDWKGISQINRAFKQVALRRSVPIVGTSQESRSNTGNVSYQSFEQDCDGLIRISRSPENKQNREVEIEVPFMRKAEVSPFVVHTLPAQNFTQKKVVEVSAGTALKDEGEPDNEILL